MREYIARERCLRNAGERGENRKCSVKVRRCLRPAGECTFIPAYDFPRSRAGAFLENRCAGNWERLKVKVPHGHWTAKVWRKNKIFTPVFCISVKSTVFYIFLAKYAATPKYVGANWKQNIYRKIQKFWKFHHSTRCTFRNIVARKKKYTYIFTWLDSILYSTLLHFHRSLCHWSYHHSITVPMCTARRVDLFSRAQLDSFQFLRRSIYDLRWIFS